MTPGEREALIVDNLPLIRQIARKIAMRLHTVDLNDLVSAGILGLLDAIDKFRPERGVKFRTYAEVRIRGAILDSLRELDWAPRTLRRKGKQLHQVSARLSQQYGRAATAEEMSEALGESLEGYQALVDQLDGLAIDRLDSSGVAGEDDPMGRYPDNGSNDPYVRFETQEITRILSDALDGLPERERMVLSLYYYEDFTMKEIGALLGVNESRISQIHSNATHRLRDFWTA